MLWTLQGVVVRVCLWILCTYLAGLARQTVKTIERMQHMSWRGPGVPGSCKSSFLFHELLFFLLVPLSKEDTTLALFLLSAHHFVIPSPASFAGNKRQARKDNLLKLQIEEAESTEEGEQVTFDSALTTLGSGLTLSFCICFLRGRIISKIISCWQVGENMPFLAPTCYLQLLKKERQVKCDKGMT